MANRDILRTMVRGAYDIQKLRIQCGNRLVGNFKAKLGQAPGEKEDELDEEGKQILADLRARFRKLTDGVKRFPKQAEFKGDEVISSYTELCLLAQYMDLEKAETTHFGRLEEILQDFKIFREYLGDVRGIGPAMAGVILSEIDIAKCRHVSSLWKYAGLDVVAQWELDHIEPLSGLITQELMQMIPVTRPMVGDDKKVDGETFTVSPDQKELSVRYQWDDRPECCIVKYKLVEKGGRSRRQEHLVDVTYTDKDGKEAVRKSITFNPFLKTKLVGVLASSFLRVKDSPYAEIYRNYKHRLESHEKYKEDSKGHRHAMAMRYMVKMFLKDLWVAWRMSEGLPVTPDYQEAKLGHRHEP